MEITFQGDYTLPAKVVAQDKSTDVAVLLVQGLENRVKPLVLGRTANVKEGEKVYATGFPMPDALGTRIKITEGIINALTGMRDDPKAFQISVPIQPGNSGGPLITADGRVIGITSAGLNDVYFLEKRGVVPQNVNFAVKSDYIMPLLDIAGASVERKDKQERVLDPVAVMDMAKEAVVFVKVTKE